MDTQVKEQIKNSKHIIKSDLIARAVEIPGISEIKDIKGSFDKENGTFTIDVYIVVDYGTKIPEIAWNVQDLVTNLACDHIGQKPKEVNIHVQGVKLKGKNV